MRQVPSGLYGVTASLLQRSVWHGFLTTLPSSKNQRECNHCCEAFWPPPAARQPALTHCTAGWRVACSAKVGGTQRWNQTGPSWRPQRVCRPPWVPRLASEGMRGNRTVCRTPSSQPGASRRQQPTARNYPDLCSSALNFDFSHRVSLLTSKDPK